MTGRIKELAGMLVLLILPMMTILSGAICEVSNIWFYVLSISWFCLGLIFLIVTEDI